MTWNSNFSAHKTCGVGAQPVPLCACYLWLLLCYEDEHCGVTRALWPAAKPEMLPFLKTCAAPPPLASGTPEPPISRQLTMSALSPNSVKSLRLLLGLVFAI